MKEYLKIGEMAQLNHISTQTLRLYASNNLLVPEYLDQKTGYRYYTLSQCAKLDLIHALKSCDMKLSEIRDLFSVTDADTLADHLRQQSEKLSGSLYRLTVSRSNLQRIERNLRLLNSLPPFGMPYFEYMDQRTIDVQKTPFDFFSQGYEGYEKMIRHMQNYMFDSQLPPSYFINIGTIIKKENFEMHRFESDLAFVFTDALYPKTSTAQILPQGLYLSIVSDEVDKELVYARALRSEIDRRNMQVNGDYICEVLSRFPFADDGQLYFKIQVPVIRREKP